VFTPAIDPPRHIRVIGPTARIRRATAAAVSCGLGALPRVIRRSAGDIAAFGARACGCGPLPAAQLWREPARAIDKTH
jgi:hypothetical protein